MGSRDAPSLGLTWIGLVMLAASSAAFAQGYRNVPEVVVPTTEGGTTGPGTVTPEEVPTGVIGGEAQPPPPPAWIIEPRIGIEEIITDNARATNVGRQADLVSIVSPGLSVTGDTARIKASLDYSLDVQRYLKATDQNRIANNLFGNGQAIVVPDLLYFDARASISQEDVAGGRGFTNSNLIPEAQRAEVIAYSAGPTLRTNIGSLLTTEMSYLVSQTHFTNNTTLTGGAGLSNSTQQEGRFVLGTGEDFDRLNTSLVADYLHSTGFGSAIASNTASGEDRKLAEVDNEYHITRTFSVIAQAGYEKLTFPGASQLNITGPIWGAGFQYNPNPDALMRLIYGRRDGGNDFSGELRFAITPATKMFITYTQQVETTQGAIIQGLDTSGLGAGGTIINPISGLPSTVVNPNFPLQNDIFRTKALQGGLISAVGRNTFTITAFREQRISLAGLLPSDTSTGASFQWIRDMSPQTSGSMFIGYAKDTIGSGPTINASIGISHKFTQTLTGGVRYDYIRGSGAFGTAIGPISATGTKFTQNALTFSLRKTF